MDLDFLYYPEKQILDKTDPKMKAFKDQITLFSSFIENCSMQEFIGLIVNSYLINYPQTKYFYRKLLSDNALDYETRLPEDMAYPDLYLYKDQIKRADISELRLIRHDDAENNTFYLKSLQLTFSVPQDSALINEHVIKMLRSVITYSFTKDLDSYIYKMEDSPIQRIMINDNYFLLTVNSDRWLCYLGSF